MTLLSQFAQHQTGSNESEAKETEHKKEATEHRTAKQASSTQQAPWPSFFCNRLVGPTVGFKIVLGTEWLQSLFDFQQSSH
jgi:hypothetical protein